MLHALLYIAMCLIPALFLLPLRFLDREPRNEIRHESEPRDQEEGRAELRAAA